MFFLRNATKVLLSEFNQIPFDYFEKKQFYISSDDDMFSLSILAMLPQLLKERFSDCTVTIVVPNCYIIDSSTYEIVFAGNQHVDNIIQYDGSFDFYKLNVFPSNMSSKKTLETNIIDAMLYFWKFENVNTIETKKIYFFKEEIDYAHELCDACGFKTPYMVLNLIDTIDRLNNIIQFYNTDNIILFNNNTTDESIIKLLKTKNILDLTEFIVPDRIKLALINNASICIGKENELFDIMRLQHPNIYEYKATKKLINIKYI
jgi:hypothetical protein